MKVAVQQERLFGYALVTIVGKCKGRFALQGKDVISSMTESELCQHSFAVLLSSVHSIMDLVIVK